MSFGSGTERGQREHEVPSSPSGLGGPTARSFITALAEAAQQKRVENPLHHVSSSATSSRRPSISVSMTHMEDEYGTTSEVMPNSTKDSPVIHEIVFTREVWTSLDWLQVLSSLGNFLTFTLCSRP